jgi:hypothetical protein
LEFFKVAPLARSLRKRPSYDALAHGKPYRQLDALVLMTLFSASEQRAIVLLDSLSAFQG